VSVTDERELVRSRTRSRTLPKLSATGRRQMDGLLAVQLDIARQYEVKDNLK